jgi:hypothetical protein
MIKLKKIKFYNNKIFKEQEFDFTINNSSVKNIILAGENGTGKTKLLEELYNALQFSTLTYDNIIYEQPSYELHFDISSLNYTYVDNTGNNSKIDTCIKRFTKVNENTYMPEVEYYSNNEKISQNNIDKCINSNINFDKLNKSIYSSVDINYLPHNEVRGITNKKLDDINSLYNSNDLAYDIIQLLVDISTADALDLSTWFRNHPNEIPPDMEKDKRMKRFTNAFKLMFEDTITFEGIKDNSIPIFKKNGQIINIQSLSSGEKQIIFRGVYLLKNIDIYDNMPVLIDEPEISMHPKWEKKIYDYYKELFSKDGSQTSQLIIATHSEHILEKALQEDEILILKLKNTTYEKYYKNGSGQILPTITSSEIKYNIFDLETTDFHILLYSHLYNYFIVNINNTNNTSIVNFDNWLKIQNQCPLKPYAYIRTTYSTLSTYIRNCIDHPDNSYSFTEQEFSNSLKFMVNLIVNNNYR